jgi:hypothetical protein
LQRFTKEWVYGYAGWIDENRASTLFADNLDEVITEEFSSN